MINIVYAVPVGELDTGVNIQQEATFDPISRTVPFCAELDKLPFSDGSENAEQGLKCVTREGDDVLILLHQQPHGALK